MDSARSARRTHRTRTSRPRRTCPPMRLEALEERTLLSLTLIKDINPVPLFPAEITGAGGNVYFVTKAADGGSDLDVKTATGVTLLKEFPTTDGSLSELTPVGSKLFFAADVGQGQQLWVTNGTRAGTRLVKNFNPGGVGDATAVGNELYFTSDVSHGNSSNRLLFKSNGTAAGTVPIAMPPGSAKSDNYAVGLVNYGGALYFGFGEQVMKTNGATAKVVGTFGPPHSDPVVVGGVGDLTVAGGMLYFTSPDASQQGEDLYATDGTARGTTLLKDFVNPSASDYLLSSFTAVGSRLFFGFDDPVRGPSLWVSDGSPAGTTFVKAFAEPSSTGAGGLADVGPPVLTTTAAGTRLFFTTAPSGPGATGNELWVSDGTAAGTTLLADIDPANAGPYADITGQVAALNGRLFFTNDDPAHGVELWQSDGTAAGTGLFLDLHPGPAGSFPGNLAAINNTLYFSATTNAGSSALWSSNGTAAGTNAVASFGSQPDGSALFENIPDAFAVLGNTMVFAADGGTNEIELWKTDGTAAGTTLIKELVPSPLAYTPSDFTTVGDQVFFDIQDATDTLWVTDGTNAGTTQIATFDGTLSDLTAFEGKLAFIESATDGTDSSLWMSDGTARGTTQVTSFPTSQYQGFGVETPTMAVLDGKLFISAPPVPSPSTDGFFTLWVSDGTAAGTMPIAGAPVTANIANLAVYQGKVYFSADAAGDSTRAQLWVSDGTAAGTRMVAKVGPAYAFTDQLLVAGPNLYILTDDNGLTANLSSSLYKSNGMARGTVLIHRFANGLPNISALCNGDLALDVNGTSSNTNPRLWVSNGTAAGTKAVKGVGGGFGELITDDGAITPIHGRFYLQGEDTKHGTELWQSDGTVAGTTLVQDINPGPSSSDPMALTELNGNLIVAADDGVHGLELLSGPIPAAPVAVTLRRFQQRPDHARVETMPPGSVSPDSSSANMTLARKKVRP